MAEGVYLLEVFCYRLALGKAAERGETEVRAGPGSKTMQRPKVMHFLASPGGVAVNEIAV